MPRVGTKPVTADELARAVHECFQVAAAKLGKMADQWEKLPKHRQDTYAILAVEMLKSFHVTRKP